MNEGQTKFFDFMMARAQAGKEAQVQEVLTAAFQTVGQGKATAAFFSDFNEQLKELIQPEALPEVFAAISTFQSKRS